GDLSVRDSGAYVPSPGSTSIERYVHRGDPRIRIHTYFVSDSTDSYYIGTTDVTGADQYDLSPASGRQYGRYNIFLMHFMPSGRLLVY
ncbi:MAG: hypothetical protein U9R56_02615, partial [candidate division Zixibacteria bacterium]|nr:hypothetical protein [candidate division Zixibacteria bacterium]